jgi:hypothetical protein
MFPPVDTRNTTAVALFVEDKFARMFPGATLAYTRQVFQDVETLYRGGDVDYSANDVRYHDLEHTLQATVCLTLILEGRHATGVEPRVSAAQFELAMAAVLLHDSGYLRLRSDNEGTGAKYTFCHVLRSCSFAASYLPKLGLGDHQIEAVLGAINCTGPSKEISRLYFRHPVERLIGCALASADYLGQMAARDYPDELDVLFEEFRESDDFLHLPPARRSFHSASQLKQQTPDFWTKVVKPKLEADFLGMYHFLNQPYPHGPNAYVEAIERNIAEVGRRNREAAARAPAATNS